MLLQNQYVKIVVFDTLGVPVKSFDMGRMNAGEHVVSWDARHNSGITALAGTYFVQLRAGRTTALKKVIYQP